MPTDPTTHPWILRGHRALLLRSDILLAIAVIAVVAMMLIPLPTFALDLLLTLNLASAVVLLLVGLYIESPLGLSALPGLLLITTLFRLALNISSTRLILLQADAGKVIDAFGNFVVQSNYVVGAVVFLILTLVQFIVIARGSERVAEVAARFTLDAMPGKQMAIDADLRAGALRLEDARQKRADLGLESQLYGAMDGAMKFVKGDAIAGLLITAINIIGGLAIGVFQNDMPLAHAARTYTLLTIGDGLISQIPALLIATSAGLIVTRVNAGSTHLGQDIAAQILRRPRPLWMAAALLAALGLIPGLPLLPFLILAALIAAAAWLADPVTADADAPGTPLLRPLRLTLGPKLTDHLPKLPDALEEARERLADDLGVPLPQVWIDAPNTALGPWDLTIDIDEIPALRLTLKDAALNDITQAVTRAVRQNSALLLGTQEVQNLLDRLREVYPADVEAVVPALLSVPDLTAILRRLLREQIPVRNLRVILSALAEHSDTSRDRHELLGHVRAALRRQITHMFTDDNQLNAWLVEREIEHMVRDAAARSRNETPTAADPELKLTPQIREAIQSGAPKNINGEGPTITLTEQDIRPFLHDLLRTEIPGLVTLAYSELTPDTRINPLGRISARQNHRRSEVRIERRHAAPPTRNPQPAPA